MPEEVKEVSKEEEKKKGPFAKLKAAADDHEGQLEAISTMVRLGILIWSASLLTFSYVRLPNGQKILDFDPTFIASVFSGSLAAFGLSPAKAGGGNGNNAPKKVEAKKEERSEPEVASAVEPKVRP